MNTLIHECETYQTDYNYMGITITMQRRTQGGFNFEFTGEKGQLLAREFTVEDNVETAKQLAVRQAQLLRAMPTS